MSVINLDITKLKDSCKHVNALKSLEINFME